MAEIPKLLTNEFKQKNFKRSSESYSGFTFVNSVTLFPERKLESNPNEKALKPQCKK